MLNARALAQPEVFTRTTASGRTPPLLVGRHAGSLAFVGDRVALGERKLRGALHAAVGAFDPQSAQSAGQGGTSSSTGTGPSGATSLGDSSVASSTGPSSAAGTSFGGASSSSSGNGTVGVGGSLINRRAAACARPQGVATTAASRPPTIRRTAALVAPSAMRQRPIAARAAVNRLRVQTTLRARTAKPAAAPSAAPLVRSAATRNPELPSCPAAPARSSAGPAHSSAGRASEAPQRFPKRTFRYLSGTLVCRPATCVGVAQLCARLTARVVREQERYARLGFATALARL
jgi:hypothetical protein